MVSTTIFILFEVVTISLTILSYFYITRLYKNPHICVQTLSFFTLNYLTSDLLTTSKGSCPCLRFVVDQGSQEGSIQARGVYQMGHVDSYSI